MPQNQPPYSLLSLEPAIDRRPLIVDPETLVVEAIAIMGKAYSSCVHPSLNVPLNSLLMSAARASGVMVMEGTQLLGTLAEQEVVRLIASGINLAKVKVIEVMTASAVAIAQSDTSNIFTALSLLRQHQIRHLPILDENKKLLGVVTLESIRQALQLDELLKLRSVAEAMHTPVIQAPATTSTLDLARLMAEHQLRSIVLTASDSEHCLRPIGTVSERDIIQLQALNLDLSQIQAQAVIKVPLSFAPTDILLVAYWEMQQRHLQQLLVASKEGELLGIVTPTSFLEKFSLPEMSSAVEELQQSIDQFKAETNNGLQNDTLEPQGEDSPAELLEQLERNRLLTKIALRIRNSLNLDEILNTAVAEVRQFLQTERVLIYRFNPDLSGTVAVESVAEGWQPSLGRTITDNCFGKTFAQPYKEGRVQVTEDIYAAGLTQCHIDILALFDIRANLVVPIVQGEHLWGLLCAYHCSEPRRWREFEVDLLKQLATQIAIAIQQSELYQQVEAELAERKRAEEQLKASLKEKEILLKEIHHRVKNNLQIISSLLKLQSAYIKDEQTIDMFKDSQNRIRSMALIHEKLYQSKDLSKINFAEYLRDLTVNLLRSYKVNSQAINLSISVSNVWLNIDTAIPCGLIINELVSNSLKHAFPSVNEGSQVSIELFCKHHNYVLIVSDNGIGFPPKLDFQNTESLGLELVCTLVEQLKASIELAPSTSSQGTSFKITFSEIGELGRN